MAEGKKAQRISYTRRENRMNRKMKRSSFVCLEINIPKGSRFMERVSKKAQEIMPNLNRGQANTSLRRSDRTVEIDNYSGIIAEFACTEILNWRYGEDKIIKPENNISFNQIDIRLFNKKTIEVRSSCVRNGLDFALFAQDKKNPGSQYFDVIGPYSNGYKPGEVQKDYYMRVLYECRKEDFMELLEDENPYIRLYITGGATMKMMEDAACYQIKHLLPEGGQVRTESDYRVIPLAKSLDIKEFFRTLEEENGMEAVREMPEG